jgi:hypothetical protein
MVATSDAGCDGGEEGERMKEFYLCALNIGGTKITAVVADQEGSVSVRLEELVQTARGKFTPWEGHRQLGLS